MRARMQMVLVAGCLLAALALPGRAGAVALQPVGTFSAPIYVTAPKGDPRLFVVEQAGTIRVVENGATLGTPFLDIHALTTTDGERGLLSMAFDPNYARNGLFYVFYTGSGTSLGEGHVDEYRVSSNPDVADPLSRRQVLTISRPSLLASNHNGGQLQFGRDGYLYISVGDGGTGGDTARNLSLLNGKILRIDPHQNGSQPYTIPPANPFYGSLSARNEIWASGLRNPWRFSFDQLDGSLVIGDVGESTREEIDYSPPSTGFGRGADYGWNCREGLIAYAFAPAGCAGAGGFTDPISDYPHSDPGGGRAFGCAIVGGFVYRGTDIPVLQGRYVYADLCTADLRSIEPRLPLGTDDRSTAVAIGANPVSFGADSRCELYIAAGSTVSKIVAAPGARPGSGGCPAASARGSVELGLHSSRHRVHRGKRVRLKAKAAPCTGAAGETVELLRGQKRIGSAVLDGGCRARFRVRIEHRSRFRVELPETASHLAAASGRITVRVKH